jgi:hypothetical protein
MGHDFSWLPLVDELVNIRCNQLTGVIHPGELELTEISQLKARIAMSALSVTMP